MVVVRPWAGATQGVDEVTATVTLSNGATFTLNRLVRCGACPAAPLRVAG